MNYKYLNPFSYKNITHSMTLRYHSVYQWSLTTCVQMVSAWYFILPWFSNPRQPIHVELVVQMLS